MRARAVLAVALALTAELVRGQGIGVGGLKAAVHQAALEKRGLATPQGDDVDPVHDKERCCTVAAPRSHSMPQTAPCACALCMHAAAASSQAVGLQVLIATVAAGGNVSRDNADASLGRDARAGRCVSGVLPGADVPKVYHTS